MFKIKYLDDAYKDMEEIKGYYLEINEELSKKVIGKIKKHILELGKHPFLYPKYPHNPSYRKMTISNSKYLVFYQVNEEKQMVEIHYILHSAREVENEISKNNIK